MNLEIFMQYITYGLMAIGILAFLVSVITQVIKEMPILVKIQTNFVALIVSILLTILTAIIACTFLKIKVQWYYIVGSIISACIVYIVATSGWERIAEMWRRNKWEEVNINPEDNEKKL